MDVFLKLRKKRRIRRLIEGTVALLSMALLIVFLALKEKGKTVTKIVVSPFLSYDSVEYANDYSIGIMISALIFALFLVLFLGDFLATRIYYTVIDGEDIIVYNGLGPIKLLVNGEETDAMSFKGYLETKLKSGVTMIVSPQFFLSYHITFSDNRPSMDL